MPTYYVSPTTGVDTTAGGRGLSSSLPWLTLAFATANSTDGDTILHLSGGTWADQGYAIGHSNLTLGVYNGTARAILDFDGEDGGDNFPLVSTTGNNVTIDSIDVRNNESGDNHENGGRGFEFTGNNTVLDNCRSANTYGVGIVRNFSGDNITIRNTILENAGMGRDGGIWSGGYSAAGNSNPVDNFHIHDCQAFEVKGEAFSAFTQHATNRCTGILFEDNDSFAGAAAAYYLNGVNGAIVRRCIGLGTSDSEYHRVTGYCGYGLGLDNESTSNSTNNDTKWYNNLIAYHAPGFLIGQGVGTAITNLYIAHVSWIDCETTLYSPGVDYDGSGNILRQIASIPITGGTEHDNGTDVPGASDWDKAENFWRGGGEHANLSSGDDFSDSAWMPEKSSGWQAVTSFGDVTTADWKPDTEVLGTQFDNPDTSSAFADYTGTTDFREAGALAFDTDEDPDPDPDPPPGFDVDIRTERHTVIFGASADTEAVTFTTPAQSASRVFARLANPRFGSAGPSAGTGSDQTLATLGITLETPTASGVTLVRESTGANVDVRCEIEVWFYDGPAGGANEFVVRYNDTSAFTDTETAMSATPSGVAAAADLVAFVTGIRGTTGGGYGHFVRARIATAADNPTYATGDVVLEREDDVGDTVVSCAVVEFTGSNWSVQQVAHTITAWNADETETISAVTWGNSFVVSSAIALDDEPFETTYNCWSGSSSTTVRFRQDNDSGTGTNFGQINAFVVSNPQMVVTHLEGTIVAGANPQSRSITVSPALTSIGASAVILTATDEISDAPNEPAHWMNYRLTDFDEVAGWRSRSSDGDLSYKAQIINLTAMVVLPDDPGPSAIVARKAGRRIPIAPRFLRY